MSNLTFKKEERLCSRKEIDAIIKTGKRNTKLGIHLYFTEYKEAREPAIKVLFAVPKKRFKKAVDRNLLKRRMREAYRLNKAKLVENSESGNKYLNLMFIYNISEIESFVEIENKIVLLLKGLFPSHESDN